MENENVEPEPKFRKSLSLKKQKLLPKERFAIVSLNDVVKKALYLKAPKKKYLVTLYFSGLVTTETEHVPDDLCI